MSVQVVTNFDGKHMMRESQQDSDRRRPVRYRAGGLSRRPSGWAAIISIAAILGGCSSSAGGPAPSTSPSSNQAQRPAPSQEYTWGQKLGAIDGAPISQWPTYEQRLAQSAARCRESEERTSDYVVFSRNYLQERGRTVSLLDIMSQGILASIPPEAAGSVNCSEVLSIWLTLYLR